MNRTDRLEKMLPSWTKVNKIKDFVIVDWASKEPIINSKIIQEQIKQYPNIKIVRVENQKYFYRCLAWNLANQYTNSENKILLKLDVDYLNIDDSWLEYVTYLNNELKNYFITGCPTFDRNSTGFLLVNKKDFGKGYNENALPVWGFEDTDLKIRLESKTYESIDQYFDWGKKLQRIVFFNIKKYIYHIPHTETERLENLAYNIDWNTITDNDKSFIPKWDFALQNHNILKRYPDWTPKEYTEIENNGNYIRLKLNK